MPTASAPVLSLNASAGDPYLRTPRIVLEELDNGDVLMTIYPQPAMLSRTQGVRHLADPAQPVSMRLSELPDMLAMVDKDTGAAVPGQQFHKLALYMQVVSTVNHVLRAKLGATSSADPAPAPAPEPTAPTEPAGE
jgi:hypothetical protein